VFAVSGSLVWGLDLGSESALYSVLRIGYARVSCIGHSPRCYRLPFGA